LRVPFVSAFLGISSQSKTSNNDIGACADDATDGAGGGGSAAGLSDTPVSCRLTGKKGKAGGKAAGGAAAQKAVAAPAAAAVAAADDCKLKKSVWSDAECILKGISLYCNEHGDQKSICMTVVPPHFPAPVLLCSALHLSFFANSFVAVRSDQMP
jgi:hypothetical protein